MSSGGNRPPTTSNGSFIYQCNNGIYYYQELLPTSTYLLFVDTRSRKFKAIYQVMPKVPDGYKIHNRYFHDHPQNIKTQSTTRSAEIVDNTVTVSNLSPSRHTHIQNTAPTAPTL